MAFRPILPRKLFTSLKEHGVPRDVNSDAATKDYVASFISAETISSNNSRGYAIFKTMGP